MNDREKQAFAAAHMNEHYGWNTQAWQFFIIPTREPGVERVEVGASGSRIGRFVGGAFIVNPDVKPRASA